MIVKFYTLDDSVMFHLNKVDPNASTTPIPDDFLVPDYGMFSTGTNPFSGLPSLPQRG